ncbi:hypothetical protein UA42_14540 [Photobacterium kishitanii]|nr:hypothetical protein UA42_14540 [Photobacterium kishitanii]KJG64870.1 hypothetical protein UA40_14240 [Photobacterium kishitanii]
MNKIMFIPNNNSYRAIITIILFLCVIVPTILTVEFDYFFNGYLYLIVGLSVTSIFYIQLLKLKSVSKLANIVLITRLFYLISMFKLHLLFWKCTDF